jgi:hypothetical protein
VREFESHETIMKPPRISSHDVESTNCVIATARPDANR